MHPFQEVIGIELHKESARLAEENMKRNLELNADNCQCAFFRILCQDMQTFDFSHVVRSGITTTRQYYNLSLQPPESIVLYLYEPLWTLPKTVAHEMYFNVISNAIFDIPSSVQEVYFVYLFAGLYGGEALSSFQEMISLLPHALKLVFEDQYFGLFFGYSDNMYIYKASISSLSPADREHRKI